MLGVYRCTITILALALNLSLGSSIVVVLVESIVVFEVTYACRLLDENGNNVGKTFHLTCCETSYHYFGPHK